MFEVTVLNDIPYLMISLVMVCFLTTHAHSRLNLGSGKNNPDPGVKKATDP